MAEDQVPYKLEVITGKGQGLVANRKLYPGTIICTEKELIVVNTAGAVNEIYPVFQSLNEDKKEAVLSLFDPGDELYPMFRLLTQDETERTVLRIFQTNCIDLCSHQEMNINKSGLYQTISKINHSCSPNVVWTWVKEDSSKSTKQVTNISMKDYAYSHFFQVRVCRDIAMGEEIVAS